MQTTIQFGATSTQQQWNDFKGKLSKVKENHEPLLKSKGDYSDMLERLSRQLNIEHSKRTY